MSRTSGNFKCYNCIKYYIIPSFYALLLFILNFIRIFDNNFWGDECFTIRLANMSVPDMLLATASDVHPPLYYFFVILANRVLGNSGWVYHLVSLIPFGIVLIFALIVLRRRFGTKTALLFMSFAGIASDSVTYNVEARMYSWAFMFVLFSFYSLYKVLLKEKYGSILFVAFSLGAAYCHYYALFSVGLFYIFLLFCVFINKIEIKKLLKIYGFTVLGYLPWLVQLLSTFRRTSEDFWLTNIPSFFDGCNAFFTSDKIWYSCLMYDITIFLFIYFWIRRISEKKAENAKATVDFLWMTAGIASCMGTLVIGLAISALIRPAFLVRYLYPVTAVFWLVFCVQVERLKDKNVIFGILILLTLLIYGPEYISKYKEERLSDQKCQQSVEEMKALVADEDMLLTNKAHLDWTILDYYFPNNENDLAADWNFDLKEENQYWLLWKNELNMREIQFLKEQGYFAERIDGDFGLGSNDFFLYKLMKD